MRLYWRADLEQPYAGIDQPRVAATPEDANVVSSETASGKHMPCIDLDVPCRLVPSSTEGHYHLYIDVEIEREKYWEILRTLSEAGIVEEGFYALSVQRGASFLRTHRKGERDHMIYPETETRGPVARFRAWSASRNQVAPRVSLPEDEEIPF